MDSIFTVTTFRINKRGKCFEFSRVVGWFPSSSQALDFVQTTDAAKSLEEDRYYSHLLIEEVAAGVYPQTKDVAWFEWSAQQDNWMQIHRPPYFQDQCNFSIG